jgi:hypothetical protein
MAEDKKLIKNIIRDTRKDVRYVIMADRKLNRDEKLREIKNFWQKPDKVRPKSGGEVLIYADE